MAPIQEGLLASISGGSCTFASLFAASVTYGHIFAAWQKGSHSAVRAFGCEL